MTYQFYRIRRKPLVLNHTYSWEKVTDEEVIATFPTNSGVIPQKLAATMVAKNNNPYWTLTWGWKVEPI